MRTYPTNFDNAAGTGYSDTLIATNMADTMMEFGVPAPYD